MALAAVGGFLSLVLRWFLGAFSRLFTVILNNFTATKIIMGVLFVTILPIILNNVIFDLMQTIFTQVGSYADAQNPGIQSTISFTGLAGYLIQQCGFVSAFTVIMSALIFRFALSWIPFVGPK